MIKSQNLWFNITISIIKLIHFNQWSWSIVDVRHIRYMGFIIMLILLCVSMSIQQKAVCCYLSSSNTSDVENNSRCVSSDVKQQLGLIMRMYHVGTTAWTYIRLKAAHFQTGNVLYIVYNTASPLSFRHSSILYYNKCTHNGLALIHIHTQQKLNDKWRMRKADSQRRR